MYPNNTQHLLNVHVTSELSEKSFSWIFWKKIIEKTRLFGKSFRFPTRISLLGTLLSTLEPCCSQTAFAKQRPAFVVFCDGNLVFQLKFVRIATLNFRYYLFFVLCLISPDFATCSVALHEFVVSHVVKMLSTFASLALSTLAPMFFHSIIE